MTTAQEEPGLSVEGFDTSWMTEANCRNVDTGIFFRKDGEIAKSYCRLCPVRVECMDWALLTDQRYGIWGGYSTKELDKRVPKIVREMMREDLGF